MTSQCFIMNVDAGASSRASDAKPAGKDKLMSYEEKSVGSTAFFKCEACPYMALAEVDIKFHLFTVHPELAKSNGLADNIQISCPGCTSIFDAEETLRNHLRNHHKMGIKDVKKMVKSLIHLALKNAKLKQEESTSSMLPQETDVKIPQVIEILPDTINANNNSLPTGVAFISVEELQKMSTPNFEKVDPKDIIQEASINIVYTNEPSSHYVNVSNAVTPVSTCSVLQVSSVTPDLISSIQPQISIDNSSFISNQTDDTVDPAPNRPGRRNGSRVSTYKPRNKTEDKDHKIAIEGTEQCAVNNCGLRLKDLEKLAYHRKCHHNGNLQCPECSKVYHDIEPLHVHLWKEHEIDMELPTCEICGYKTYKKYRLYNIHMKCHGDTKSYSCSQCLKSFKNANQLSKHRVVHKREGANCPVCHGRFSNQQRLKIHVATVHEKLKQVKCCHCDYTASRKEEMKLHLRSHTGAKPYSCDECNYCCADHNAMRRHKKVHSKESLYKCKYCPYSCIQSTWFTSHMISKHPNVNSSDVHRCPYCSFKSTSKDNYIIHLRKHTDKEGVQLLIEMTKDKPNKPSWTIPSETAAKAAEDSTNTSNEQEEMCPKTVNTIPIEVFDCDSLSESLSQNFSKNFASPSNDKQQTNFNTQITDLSKDDNNADCLISDNPSDSLRHQFTAQHTLQNLTYDNTQANLHGYLNAPVQLEQSLCPNSTVSSLVSSHSVMGGSISSSIMGNFPIRLPPVPQLAMRNNITLNPVHKISLPMTKVTGPIITPTQILPVPSSSNSPVNIFNEPDGMPRKKPKISVKSNLILKGPDEENMFHSQQKMAFKQLEDNERFGLGAVTFNNLITTQFMQLQPEPGLSESPSAILPYQEPLLHDAATPPVGSVDNSQMFSFNNQMNVNSITLLPPPQKMQTNDPSYIKIEATIKQNTQSPSLERMCNANIVNNQTLSREYKASPPLEDIHKNINEIKNEVKSDAFYNMALNTNNTNPSIIDQYLIDNIIGEQYSGHMDLATGLPEVSDDPQSDVIEIDDNSDDNKLLSRYDINFPLESLYLMHNDFHFLENDVPSNNLPIEVNELNRIVTEVPIINQKETLINPPESTSNDYTNFIQGKKDPMMNTSVRQSVNKINVKNIELMKN